CARDLERVAARASRHARAFDPPRPVCLAVHTSLQLCGLARRGALLRPYLAYDQKVNVYYSYPLGALRGSTLVLGVRIAGIAKAYPLYLLRRPISDVVAGHRLRVVPDPDALVGRGLRAGEAIVGDAGVLVRLARLLSGHADLRAQGSVASRRSGARPCLP